MLRWTPRWILHRLSFGCRFFSGSPPASDCLPFSDRNLKRRLHALNAGLLSVRSRGFPESSEAIRVRLQGELHGDIPYRLFVYRAGERHHAVITDFERSVDT